MKYKKPEIQEIKAEDIPIAIRLKLYYKKIWKRLWR